MIVFTDAKTGKPQVHPKSTRIADQRARERAAARALKAPTTKKPGTKAKGKSGAKRKGR